MRIRYLLIILFPCTLLGQEISVITPFSNRTVEFTITEGYVDHPTNGESKGDAIVYRNELNVQQAIDLSNYSISSLTDQDFFEPQSFIEIFRKTKPVDFADYCDSWGVIDYYGVLGCQNEEDHILEHKLYLQLEDVLKSDNTYTISLTNDIYNGTKTFNFSFDTKQNISSLIHTNNIAYSTNAPNKHAYVYAWIGNGGAYNLSQFNNVDFNIRRSDSDAIVYTGVLAFRKDENQAESYRDDNETPNNNYNGASVYECDFSSFNDAGSYYLEVENIGRSFDFDISCDAYRKPFQSVMKGVFQNRSGISLTSPYVMVDRPAPHNVNETPGFSGRLKYTSTSWCDVSDSDADIADKDLYEENVLGNLTDTWGWYQDAGDWDGYERHFEVSALLMFAYEHFPENFVDNQLLIQENSNDIPDILDEARWLLRFYKRLKDEKSRKGGQLEEFLALEYLEICGEKI